MNTPTQGKEICTLRKMALGKAMGEYFSELHGDDYIDWYTSYEILIQCKNDDEMHENFTIWQPFESEYLEELIERVETFADSLYSDFHYILETAKKGMITQGDLLDCSNINQIDMLQMFSLGYAKHRQEISSI